MALGQLAGDLRARSGHVGAGEDFAYPTGSHPPGHGHSRGELRRRSSCTDDDAEDTDQRSSRAGTTVTGQGRSALHDWSPSTRVTSM